MTIPDILTIETQDQARNLAIDWQAWAAERDLSYGELAEWQNFFESLAAQFPELADEFKENGII